MTDRVTNLIHQYGASFVLDVCSKWNKNSSGVEILNKSVITFDTTRISDPDNVYTLQELLEGLESYNANIAVKDQHDFGTLRSTFEPIARKTTWFKENFSQGSCGSGTVFSFFDGKYTESTMIQGMFEVYCMASQWHPEAQCQMESSRSVEWVKN